MCSPPTTRGPAAGDGLHRRSRTRPAGELIGRGQSTRAAYPAAREGGEHLARRARGRGSPGARRPPTSPRSSRGVGPLVARPSARWRQPGQLAQQRGQRPGPVGHQQPQRQVAARRRPCRAGRPCIISTGSMLPPDTTATTGGANAVRVGQQRRDGGHPGRLDHQLRPLQAEQQGPGQVALGDGAHLVDQPGDVRQRSGPRARPTAIPSAIVAIEASGTGRPAASEAGNAAAAAACTATTRTSGRQRLHRGGDPGDQPAAAGARRRRWHVRALLEQLQAHGALPGDDVGVVEGVDEHRRRSAARTPAAETSASVSVCPAQPRVGAVAAGGGDLGQRRATPA